PSPARDSDRALLSLVDGDPAAALIAATAVLDAEPDHRQAQWNRALALRDLGLPLTAAAAFEEVAGAGEPGWADEATARAARLRGEQERRDRAYRQLYADGIAAIRDGGAPPAPERLAAYPGLGRLLLYDLVRAAPDA